MTTSLLCDATAHLEQALRYGEGQPARMARQVVDGCPPREDNS